jgi:hypothetical protein
VGGGGGRLNRADPRLGCRSQAVVIDARAHMLGRLASVVAKQILAGQHIVSSAVSGLVRRAGRPLLATEDPMPGSQRRVAQRQPPWFTWRHPAAGAGPLRGAGDLRRPGPPEGQVRALPAQAHEHQPHPGPVPLPRALPHLLAHRARVRTSWGPWGGHACTAWPLCWPRMHGGGCIGHGWPAVRPAVRPLPDGTGAAEAPVPQASALQQQQGAAGAAASWQHVPMAGAHVGAAAPRPRMRQCGANIMEGPAVAAPGHRWPGPGIGPQQAWGLAAQAESFGMASRSRRAEARWSPSGCAPRPRARLIRFRRPPIARAAWCRTRPSAEPPRWSA